LAGDREGTKPIVVDDFLVVEVLGADGALIDAGVVNPPPDTELRVADRAARRVGPTVPIDMQALGYVFPPGAIDVTSLIPKGRQVKLRVSAFDVGGAAATTDVFARYEAQPPAPPPVTDPFDPASCADPPMTQAEARAKLAPATTSFKLPAKVTLAARKRTCHPVTGCAEWGPASKLPLTASQTSQRAGDFDLPTLEEQSYVLLRADASSIHGTVLVSNGARSLYFWQSLGSSQVFGPYHFANAAGSANASSVGPSWSGSIRRSCARFTTSVRVGEGYPFTGEYEAVILATYP
jgi:hypothetical protein